MKLLKKLLKSLWNLAGCVPSCLVDHLHSHKKKYSQCRASITSSYWRQAQCSRSFSFTFFDARQHGRLYQSTPQLPPEVPRHPTTKYYFRVLLEPQSKWINRIQLTQFGHHMGVKHQSDRAEISRICEPVNQHLGFVHKSKGENGGYSG